MTTDYTGAPLDVGARVEAWLDLNRFIAPYRPQSVGVQIGHGNVQSNTFG